MFKKFRQVSTWNVYVFIYSCWYDHAPKFWRPQFRHQVLTSGQNSFSHKSEVKTSNATNLHQKSWGQKFDIIFLDPPYKIKNLIEIFEKIQKSMILNKEGIIILHRHKNEEDNFPTNFKILEKKQYGISKLIFISL